MIWLWMWYATEAARRPESALQSAGRSQCAHSARIPSAVHVRVSRMKAARQMTMLSCLSRMIENQSVKDPSQITLNCNLPIDVENPPPNLDGSRGFMMSPTPPPRPRWPPRGRQPPPPFFFFDLDDNFLFLVWIPSFFMVRGRFTCDKYTTNWLPSESIYYTIHIHAHTVTDRQKVR